MLLKLYRLFCFCFLSPKNYAKTIGVKFGEKCRIVSKNFGSEPFLIEIGNHVHITRGVSFVTHDGGAWIFRNKIKDLDVFGKIKVGNNTYIGNNSIILPGVTIGDNCIIGANSVVTKSIPDNIIIAGNPAKFINYIDNYKDKMMPLNAKTKGLSYSRKYKKLLTMDETRFIKKNIISIIE